MTASPLRRAFLALMSAALLSFPSAQVAHAGWSTSQEAPLVIRSDRGGRLKGYMERYEGLKASGRQVQILGKCQSSCTIFLGLDNVCVGPHARLGFHGPRLLNGQISEDRHLFWSKKMAQFYPAEVAAWFMRDARHVEDGVKVLRGENLVRLGVPRC